MERSWWLVITMPVVVDGPGAVAKKPLIFISRASSNFVFWWCLCSVSSSFSFYVLFHFVSIMTYLIIAGSFLYVSNRSSVFLLWLFAITI